MNRKPDSENKQNPGTPAKNEGKNVRRWVERKGAMELAIAGATSVAVVLWIISGALAYTHRENGFIWTIFFAVVFSILPFFLTWQKSVSERPQPVATTIKRPELYISGAMMKPLVAGQPETVVLGLKNRGNAVARNIRLGGGNDVFALSSFSGPLEYQPTPITARPDLGPGEENSLVSQPSQPLTKDQIKELQEGKLLFFHFAEGEYEGDDGTSYPIDFCFMYEPLAQTVMRVCPDKYWPKERKDRKRAGRPELSLEAAKVFFRPGNAAMVRIYLRNRGNMPARNIGFSGVQILRSPSDKGALKPGPLGEPDMFPSLAVGAGMQGTTYGSEPMSIKDIADIKDGKRLFFHYSDGRYEDDMANVYSLELCLLYMPNVPGLEDDIAIAPREYWPKKNATQDNPAMKDNEKPKTTNTTINRSIVNSPGAAGNVLGDVNIHHHAPTPRYVTIAQANKMIAVLRPYAGSTLAIAWLSNNNEAFTYADQITRVFQSAGWTINALGAFFGTAVGVGVVCEGKFPIAEATAVVAAFREAEVQITERPVPGWKEGNWRLTIGEKP